MLKSHKINLKGFGEDAPKPFKFILKGFGEDAQDPERCGDTRSDLVYENK